MILKERLDGLCNHVRISDITQIAISNRNIS